MTHAIKRFAICAALTLGVLGTVPVAPAQAAPTLGQRALTEAARHYNKPYQYGAAGPSRFDCSGFTMYVFKRLGRSLPHQSSAQYNAPGVKKVTRSTLRFGDLVFTIRNGRIGHVGIYAGNNQMWASTQTGDVVRKQSMSNRTLVFGRVM